MPDEAPRGDGPHTDRPDHAPGSIPARAAPSAYQSTLLRIIEAATNDPAQLRRLVYDVARLTLKRETWQTSPTFTSAEVKECLRALETAIARVETDSSRGELVGLAFPSLTADPAGLLHEPPRIGQTNPEPNPERPRVPEPVQIVDTFERAEMANSQVLRAADPAESAFPAWLARPQSQNAETGGAPVPLRAGERWSSPEPALFSRAEPLSHRSERPQVEIVYPGRENSAAARLRRRAWLWFIAWPVILITVPVALSIALYLAIAGKLGEQDEQTRLAAIEKSRPPVAVEETVGGAPSGLPLPSKYGVYAISNGALSELEALPIKAPDPRVMLSAEISKPSTTLLPDGKVVFVVFRRELVNSAPQKATVRVVARVGRVMSFGVGKLATTDVQNSWRIRSNSYDFNVSPISESREMVAIRPEAADFVFPAGRYALVLSGLAYDFTVDGLVTDAAQCLEGFAAANGPVFTQCRPN